jgi:hypothetical protein
MRVLCGRARVRHDSHLTVLLLSMTSLLFVATSCTIHEHPPTNPQGHDREVLLRQARDEDRRGALNEARRT